MARRRHIDPLKKLAKRDNLAKRVLLQALWTARSNITLDIRRYVEKARIATSAKEREELFSLIRMHYGRLGAEIDSFMQDMVKSVAPDWHKVAADDLGINVKFSRDRVKRYWEMIHPDNTQNLAAVFTQKMSESSIRQLRQSFLDVYRQSQLEGWTANETSKRLQARWDAVAGNMDSRRFTDASGRAWSNAHYLQMLHRTNMQRVARDSYIDTLVDAGAELARISDDGDPCPVCSAWSGLIIQVAGSGQGGGRFPTYEQSRRAGMWHPNCMCRLEYIDPALEGDEIDRQKEQPAPKNWDEPEEVQQYHDQIGIKRHKDAGMNTTEAERRVKREKLERSLRGNLLGKYSDAVDQIPNDVLDAMPMSKVPRFQRAKDGKPSGVRKSSKGGVVTIDPKDEADLKELLSQLKTKTP